MAFRPTAKQGRLVAGLLAVVAAAGGSEKKWRGATQGDTPGSLTRSASEGLYTTVAFKQRDERPSSAPNQGPSPLRDQGPG
jgi:hypothetical protein